MTPAPHQSPAKKKPRWRRVAGVIVLALLVAIAAVLVGVYRASRHVPVFYEEALRYDPIVARDEGDELERRALELQNATQHGGGWEQIFTEDQINGWLAVDLVEKFPDLLPAEVQAPRVSITPGEVLVACRYQNENVDTIISLAASAALTDEPNVVAVRILRARAGALPIPLRQFLDEVAQAAHGSNLEIRWVTTDGDPVALIRLPAEHTDLPDRTLSLKAIELRKGEAYLSGETTWKNSLK
jgi:hypothetical protein